MSQQHTVALIGDSLLMAAMAASLREQYELEVLCCKEAALHDGSLLERDTLAAVIIDLTTFPAERALALLQSRSGLPLIGLDVSTDALILLSSQRHAARTLRDLAQMIQELTMS